MNMDIEEKRKKAEAGSTVAQTVLGISYLYGLDVDVDYKEALRFLSAAANQGASRAVLSLGIMHAKGLGIPQNLHEAARLLDAVAKPSGSSDAFAARLSWAACIPRAYPSIRLKLYVGTKHP